MLVHALRGRCPPCGEPDVWRSWGQMRVHCPTCGWIFEREEGYWVGAMIVNHALALMAVFVYLVGGLLYFRADVPGWFIALSITLVLAQGFWLYPRSKTAWIWLDIRIHPYGDDEQPSRT